MAKKNSPSIYENPINKGRSASPGKSHILGHQDFINILEQANQIASMTSLRDLLDQMLELMIKISGAEAGTLYLLDREAGELIFEVVKGEEGAHQLAGLRMKQNQGIVGAAIQKSAPIVIDNLSEDPRWYHEISPEYTAHLYNAITFPLLLQGEPIGAIQIFNFTSAELELLQLLGNRMASEVVKALLLENEQKNNQRLKRLVNIIGQIGAILDRDTLLNLIAEKAAELLDADHSNIMLVDENGEEILVVSNKIASPQQNNNDFHRNIIKAHSTLAVPLRARPISVGKEKRSLEERIIGNLMIMDKRTGDFDVEDIQLLEILSSQASTVLQITNLYNESNQLFLDFIRTLAETIDAKDPYTRGHSQRVANLSVSIGNGLSLPGEHINEIYIGSLLHDIGKIGVPDQIITKPDKLTPDEFEKMKRHPAIGYRILIGVRPLKNSLPAVAEHHERVDGSGYPFGLRGDQISLMGKIVAVADVFDAMTTNRPYRKAMDIEAVFDHLLANIGTHFDSNCVHALINSELHHPQIISIH